MKKLISGENMPVPSGRVRVRISCTNECDVSTFCLYSDGKTKGDDDFIFYGQTANKNRTVVFSASPHQTEIVIDLERLDPAISKVAIAASNDDKKIETFGSMRMQCSTDGGDLFEADFVTAGRSECALILGELYRYKGGWKVKMFDQGFVGGLKPLAEFYGVEIADASGAPAQSSSRAQSSSPASSAPSQSATPPPRPSRISLTKKNPRVQLEKRPTYSCIKVNLNWNRGGVQPPSSSGGGSGFFSSLANALPGFGGRRKSGGIDLDLGAYVKLNSGEQTIVQALGGYFGSFDKPPYVQLLGDDRTGQQVEGEWIHINGNAFKDLREVLIFTFIYDGVPNWAATDAVVTLHITGEPLIETAVTEGDNRMGMCAIARILNEGGSLRVERINRYFRGHKDMDEAFGWGFSWTRGSK